MSETRGIHQVATDEESPEAELRRMVRSGSLWFAAVLLAGAIGMAAVMISGWRPGELAPLGAAIWWLGALAGVGALGCFGWSGCPTLGFPLRDAVRQKQVCSRLGVILTMTAGVLMSFAVLVEH